jgi:hypothetical protein
MLRPSTRIVSSGAVNGTPVARVRAWLERAAADDVDPSVVDDLLEQVEGTVDLRVTPAGTHVGFAPAAGGEPHRHLELDRHGTLLTVLRRTSDGRLARAWVRAADRTWIAIEPRATHDAPWGLSDRLWRSERLVADRELPGKPLTVFEAVSWDLISTIPVLAEPARLPSGTGTAVLNLLASLAQDQGRAALDYRGPYPTEQLFLALLECFRYGPSGVDPLDAFMRGSLAWTPSPFERVFLGSGVCLHRRHRIEKVTWHGRTYYRPDWQGVRRHTSRQIEDVPGGVLCVIHALGLTLEEHLAIDLDAGRVEVRARPVAGDIVAMPDPVGPAVAALVAAASAEPLAPFILHVGARLDFEWGPVEADLLAEGERSVRVSIALRSALSDALRGAASPEGRHRVALLALEEMAQLVGDSLRARAQAKLAALDRAAQEAALLTPARDETARRQAAIGRAVAAGVQALAAPEGNEDQTERTMTQTLNSTKPTSDATESPT